MKSRIAFPPAVQIEREREPEAAEEISAEHIAGPMRAQVNARESDECDRQNGGDEGRAPCYGASRQERIGDEEEETEIADVKGDVARREAFVARIDDDVDQVRSGARARNEELEQTVEQLAASGAENESRRFAPLAEEQKQYAGHNGDGPGNRPVAEDGGRDH